MGKNLVEDCAAMKSATWAMVQASEALAASLAGLLGEIDDKESISVAP